MPIVLYVAIACLSKLLLGPGLRPNLIKLKFINLTSRPILAKIAALIFSFVPRLYKKFLKSTKTM